MNAVAPATTTRKTTLSVPWPVGFAATKKGNFRVCLHSTPVFLPRELPWRHSILICTPPALDQDPTSPVPIRPPPPPPIPSVLGVVVQEAAAVSKVVDPTSAPRFVQEVARKWNTKHCLHPTFGWAIRAQRYIFSWDFSGVRSLAWEKTQTLFRCTFSASPYPHLRGRLTLNICMWCRPAPPYMSFYCSVVVLDAPSVDWTTDTWN